MISTEVFKLYAGYGLSCIPCNQKLPSLPWKWYQTHIPSADDFDRFKGTQIACICGAVSGGLICIDFDIKNGDRFSDWQTIVTKVHPDILSKMVIETSPSGGYHVIFRSAQKIGNKKLACNPDNLCMIETRGEGGFFCCAPSEGYKFYYSDFSQINTVSESESQFLIDAAIALDETLKTEHPEPVQQSGSGITPLDDYNSKESAIPILVRHGWKVVGVHSGTTYLRRPGKDDRSISASWNKIPDRFYCFSTSTPFENQKVYKTSGVYTVLEHNGDYHAAAKALYHAGYGTRAQQKQPEVQNHASHAPQQKAVTLDVSKIKSKILDIKLNGYQRGKTTGWKTLDKMFSVAKKQFTVITGVPSAGKSEFMDALAVNLMMYNHWKFAVFSPENYPAEMHYHKLIEKIKGKELRNIDDDDIDIAIKVINEHFFFIDALEDDLTLDSILQQTKDLIETQKVDALIIDPWNEIELSRPNNVSESDFIGNCLRISRKFARKYNIHLFIVAHPTKLAKNKDGKYPIPELWDISGSAHWRNKADNGICVHRDYESKCTLILVQKVKFKYFGTQGECKLYYEEKSGRYNENQSDPVISSDWYK
jgi:hypothetical protein